MKRIIAAVVLALTLALLVTACGGSSGDQQTPASPAPAGTAAQTATPAATAGADGGQVFAENCTGCHGQDGSGGTGPDLRSEDDLAGVAEKVAGGDGQMPSFQGQLDPEQIQAVADYVVNQL